MPCGSIFLVFAGGAAIEIGCEGTRGGFGSFQLFEGSGVGRKGDGTYAEGALGGGGHQERGGDFGPAGGALGGGGGRERGGDFGPKRGGDFGQKRKDLESGGSGLLRLVFGSDCVPKFVLPTKKYSCWGS